MYQDLINKFNSKALKAEGFEELNQLRNIIASEIKKSKESKICELTEKQKQMVEARKEVMDRRIEEEKRIFFNFQSSQREFFKQEAEREREQANNAMMAVAKIFDNNQSRLRQTLSATNDERRDTAE